MTERTCAVFDLNGDRALNLYPTPSGVLLTDGDEESSVVIPHALLNDVAAALMKHAGP